MVRDVGITARYGHLGMTLFGMAAAVPEIDRIVLSSRRAPHVPVSRLQFLSEEQRSGSKLRAMIVESGFMPVATAQARPVGHQHVALTGNSQASPIRAAAAKCDRHHALKPSTSPLHPWANLS